MLTVCLPMAWALRMRVNMSAMGSVMLMVTCASMHRYPKFLLSPARFGSRSGLDYQLALRRPGTSPRMVASRNLLRASPNLAYTPRERPDNEQRLRWREGLASRGSFCNF